MKAKKIMAILMTGALAASILAGCGGSGSDSSSAAPAADAATEEAAEPAEEATEEAAPEETAEEAAPEETAEEAAPEEAAETASADDGTTPRNETLYFAGQQWGTPNDFNPLSSNSNNFVISQNDSCRAIVYEPLFLYNMLDGQMYPLLATDWAWDDEAQTSLTIHLNKDAHWSDGSDFTADDVVYTFDVNKELATSGFSDYSTYIDSFVKIDDDTVQIKAALNEDGTPVNPLKVLEWLPKMYQLNKAYVESVKERNNGDADAIKQDPMEDCVHTGPYSKFYTSDQKVVYVRDDNYWGVALWGKLPVPKYLAHTIFKDNAAGQVALSQGEVDVCQQFITDVQELWLTQELPISTWLDEAPYGLTAVMPSAFFNTTKNGLDQVAVRKAIAMAVDYDQIIASAMSGQSPTFQELPRCIAGPDEAGRALVDFDRLESLQFYGGDIDGANALLDEAGIKDTDGDGIREFNGENLSYKAECPSGWTDWNASMEIIANAGKEIGIDIQTYFPDANTYYDDMTNGKFDICMWSSPAGSVTSPWSKAMFYLSETYGKIEAGNWSGNFGHYMNDEAEGIIQAIPTMTDEAELKEAYTRLSEIWLEEVPSFALMYRPSLFYAVNETVWTNYPAADDGRNIPPTDLTDGYGIAGLYELELVE